MACLAAAITAIGVAMPWSRLLLVWSAGAATASFSPTPYGLGVVEIALIVALRGAGLRSPDAVRSGRDTATCPGPAGNPLPGPRQPGEYSCGPAQWVSRRSSSYDGSNQHG